jgi:hypothetical protein
MKHIITIAIIFLGVLPASAQLEKTLYQTFDLEGANNIAINIPGDYIIEPWASSYLMTETHVQLFGASPSILTYLADEELRYQFDPELSDGQFKLVNHDKKREDLHTHFGPFTEVVKVKVFVPEEYLATGDENTVFKKKEDSLSKQ